EHFRLRQFGGGAEVNNPLALRDLERFNYAPRRVILFREFNRGIRQGASALIAARDMGGHVLEPATKLSAWIPGMLRCQRVPGRTWLIRQTTEVFREPLRP